MIVYGDMISGNCLKVKFTADYLGIPYTWVPVDVVKGEARKPEFLAMSPMGQVPVVDFGGGRILAQSNAIIHYLARGSELLPADPFMAAKVEELLFWEQYSHEPYVAVARFLLIHPEAVPAERLAELPARQKGGYAALDVMERHLAGRRFFVGEAISIADIALYAYTHVADEGGLDLARYPAIRSWLGRVRAEPGYIPITQA